MWALYLARIELPTLEASALLLPHNSRRQGNDLYHAPDSYISNTKFIHAPLAEFLYPSLDFGILGKDSATPRESVELSK